MAIISRSVEIMADADRVYDLISKVEEFSLYSDLIDSIKETTPKTYHWKARLGAIPVEWDAVVIEERRPRRFAWRSIKGFENSGSYTLTPSGSGTTVCFEMEFHLPVSILEQAISLLSDRYMNKLSEDILGEIKKRIEVE
ncbi:MAG: SRPBCC family protein [bacterium]|nr:SRPBCC family protein [bacterium]